MTKEEARKAAEIMLAYADGKEVESRYNKGTEWLYASVPIFDWSNCKYRIKSKPKYRPYNNLKECFNDMKNHEPFGYLRQKRTGNVELVTGTLDDRYEYLRLSLSSLLKLDTVFERYTYFDGQPFGVLKKD